MFKLAEEGHTRVFTTANTATTWPSCLLHYAFGDANKATTPGTHTPTCQLPYSSKECTACHAPTMNKAGDTSVLRQQSQMSLGLFS